jgi:MoxR-like ATPase
MPSSKDIHFLRLLNIYGLDHLDPLILGALVDAQPLLLIGPHGTAKSEVLNRIAHVLGLEHRHYNASLISFDDLLGFPVPNDARTKLTYIHTPGSLWNAESVFLDELSRCRAESQNKLFSIIHERRVQGIELPRLRYRWSAINPPPPADGEFFEGRLYTGSLPLDPALADRFTYVIEVPAFSELNEAARKRLISEGGEAPEVVPQVQALLNEAHNWRAAISPEELAWVCSYLSELVRPLEQAGYGISGRRAVFLKESIQSVYSAGQALGLSLDLADATLLTLQHGLPHPAEGIRVNYSKLLAVHREVLNVLDSPPKGIWRRLRSIKDPVQRVAVALGPDGKNMGQAERSSLVLDAYAGLTKESSYLFAHLVLARCSGSPLLNNPAYETLSEPLSRVVKFCSAEEHGFERLKHQARHWDDILAAISNLKACAHDSAELVANILYTVFVVEQTPYFSVAELLENYNNWSRWFGEETIAVNA